jgi:hypothetical protein
MQTENYFSVYGSGYAAQRQAGHRIFREALPSRSQFVVVGAALFIVVAAFGSFAYNVMTAAHAGAQFAARQGSK